MAQRRSQPAPSGSSAAIWIWRSLSLLLASALLAFVALALTGRLAITAVRSAAMSPTIEKGDRLLAARLAAVRPAVGEIVVFQTRGIGDLGAGLLALRVAGRPGDKLELRDGILFVNDIPAPMENASGRIRYRTFATAGYLNAFRRIVTVPQGQYFLLGDNTANSNDSRFWGFVPAENLTGRVRLRVGPMAKFGKVR